MIPVPVNPEAIGDPEQTPVVYIGAYRCRDAVLGGYPCCGNCHDMDALARSDAGLPADGEERK